MTTRVWHPGIEAEGGPAFADVDDSAVPVMRQSGWLLATERDEHVERVAAHPSQAGEGKAKGRRRAAREETSGEAAAGDPAAEPGGDDAGAAGTEGS